MGRIRKRVFAAGLAAALLFTTPGMASYASEESVEKDVLSQNAIVRGGTAYTEELETEDDAIPEPELDDIETGELKIEAGGEKLEVQADNQDAAGTPAPAEETKPDLSLFGQDIRNGDSGEGWSYADGVLTLENYHADDSSGDFIHIANGGLDFTIYLKGDNFVKTDGCLAYGNSFGSTTITGDAGASLSLDGRNWNEPNIDIRGVNVDVTTQGMIFLSHNMVIDNATVNINMNGPSGYIYTTHGDLTIRNGSKVTMANLSGNADYCVATNGTKITDSTLNVTNPNGFGVYVTAISAQVPEHKAVIANSAISANASIAGIHCEDEASITNSQITNSGQFLLRSKKTITVDGSSTMTGIIYEHFKSPAGIPRAYQAYGQSNLVANLTVGDGESFLIPEGAALTIPAGVTLENNGTMRIHDKASLTGAGTLTGNGSFLMDMNEDLILVPEGWSYTGEDLTEQIKNAVSLKEDMTICGKTFQADTESWTLGVAKESDLLYKAVYTHTDGRTLSKDVSIAKAQITLSDVVAYKEDGTTPADAFEGGEKIIIRATAAFPDDSGIRAAAFPEPAGGQMAAYYGERQISEPVSADADGAYAMTVDTNNLPEEALNREITLTVKYIESDNVLGTEASVAVTVAAAVKVEKAGIISYMGERSFLDAIAANGSGNGAAYTLLRDIAPSISVKANADSIVLDLNGHSITTMNGIHKQGINTVTIRDGLGGGSIISQSPSHNAFSAENGPGLAIEGGTLRAASGTALYIQNGKAVISGGAFEGIECGEYLGATLIEQLKSGYCFYGQDNQPIPLEAGQKKLTGTVTVGQCSHTGEGVCGYVHEDGTTIHTRTCLACGKKWDGEACSFDENGDCPCGAQLVITLPADLNLTYTGTAQEPAVTVTIDGKTTLTENADYSVAYENNIDAGENTAKVIITGTGAAFTGRVEKKFSIGKAASDIGTVTADPLNDTLDASQVVLHRTNQTPAGTLALADDTRMQYGTNTYTWRFTPEDTVNYKPATGTVAITVNDTIPPSAEYQIGTDGWKKFVNTISFGLFCKDYKTVAIRGTDDTDTVTGSGIAKTEYHISNQEVADTASVAWNTYTEPISLNAQGTYFIYVKVTDKAGNTATLNSEGIVIYAESAASPTALAYTYKQNQDCTVQLAMNGNTFKGLTDKEGNAVDTAHYTIANGALTLKAAYLDTLDRGTYTYQVSMNPQGIETDQVAPTCTFTVHVRAKELTVTGAAATDRAYDGTDKVEITAVTLSGILPNDDVAIALSGVKGTLSSANAGTYTAVTLPELTLTGAHSGNYILVQPTAAVPTSVDIARLDGEITVGTDTYHKTFGDESFPLEVTHNNTEADLRYEVTAGADVLSVSNGKVTIRNAGQAAITVSLPETTNYNAAISRTITVDVAQKGGYTVADLNRVFLYSCENTDSIDLASLLPKDCGTVDYGAPSVSGAVTYIAGPVVEDGRLSYTLDRGNIGDEGTIAITVETRNYKDIAVTVNVKLADRIPVSLKPGAEVALQGSTLTYGEALGKLVFLEAEFVGSDGKAVEGILAWKDSAARPDAGTTAAPWIFTPTDERYIPLEGSVAITVNKAVPHIPASPTVSDRIYNPSIALKDSDLKAVAAMGVDGKNLDGTWSWQEPGIVPTVENSGYAAVFTPQDTSNYEIVTRLVTLNVKKAVPYIADLPTAAEITYGDTLSASTLSGGTVLHGSGTGQAGSGAGSAEAVAGTFTWKEPSAKPAVADSNVTEYTVVFMPFDAANYDPVEAKVRLTVNKAQDDPNKPGSGTPFIKGKDGKTGWDVIRAEEEKVEEGATINVDMNGATVVPGDIFDRLKGRNITITFDMGGGIVWSVDGKSIVTDKAGNIDFSVKTGTDTIPVDIINNVTGESYSIQISLAHEGEFGFTAVLSINLGKENAGLTAKLYYYNEATGALEFICKDKIAGSGVAKLAFTHASDYVIVIDSEQEEDNDTEATTPPPSGKPENNSEKPKSPKTGQAGSTWWIVLVILLTIAAGTGGILIIKKEERDVRGV